ncbi:MAG TPA: hypothetical protein VGP82_16620 [Ktedonobacterales bacterium]|nr:hypothetical protein [Ktedonobacterales bacterium]
MSRANRTRAEQDVGTDESRAIAAFLRGLAERVELDATFATQIASLLRESGLLAMGAGRAPARAGARTPRAPAGKPSREQREIPNPFAVLRERGEPGLREAIASLELPDLRQIVRTHRLDPARISARWTTRDRVVTLIIDQVRARANLGRAFERV